MHLMISCASAALSEEGLAAVQRLRLPGLSALLARLRPAERLGGDEDSLSTPLEQALARELGWQAEDGCLPWAARAAEGDGIDPGQRAWGLLTPVHWHVATDHVSVTDPAALQLDAADSQRLFDIVRPLFESEGWHMVWGAPLRWYVAHPSLDGFACASLDRVLGSAIEKWLPPRPEARLLRRLQNEAQMLLYQHPFTDERSARGGLPVNSFWLSGCGRHQPQQCAEAPIVEERLQAPLRAGDVSAWAQAWEALDAECLLPALKRVDAGQAFRLTLAGERHAQSFETGRPRGWLKRLLLKPASISPWLEAL